MNKKILIGGICTTIILVLVSFSSVVGYNPKTSNVCDSPLFNVRTKNAINQKQNSLTNNYVGKNSECVMPLQFIPLKIKQLQKTLDIIKKLDDKEFSQLIDSAISELLNNNQINEDEISKVIEGLRYVREGYIGINQLANEKQQIQTYNPNWGGCTFGEPWFPGCYINAIITTIFAIVGILLIQLLVYYTSMHDCLEP